MTRPDSHARDADVALREGIRFQQAGRLDEAIRVYEGLVAERPEWVAAWSNLGVALRASGRRAAALACYRRAAEIDPHQPGVLGNLGNLLKDLDLFEEAVTLLRGAVAQEPANPHTHRNLGLALKEAGELEAALEALDEACRLDPSAPAQRFERALLLLQLGRFREGWVGYESRWELPEMQAQARNIPRWQGEPFPGRTLLVEPEQGFGDSILASRYLAAAKQRGGTVVLACKPALRRLLEQVEGVDRVVAHGADVPEADLHCPIMSLPGIFETTLDSIPAPARLCPAHGARDRLAPLLARAGERFRVGVVWSGSLTFKGNRRRAVPVERFLELARQPGLQLYSLQKGSLESELVAKGAGAAIIDVGGVVSDFAETAAFIEALDLVIMTDSAVAHLTGSLGKPVWNLLASVPSWLYGTEGERTAWYPSMRLFRPRRFGDWDDVFAQVSVALEAAVRSRDAGNWPQDDARQPSHGSAGPPTAFTLLQSAFSEPGGAPRFSLPLTLTDPRDPGLSVLSLEERYHGGFEYPTRRFLDEHLEPGDLFVDVGAHWGVFSLHAATRHRSEVAVLSIEPHPANLVQLENAVRANGLAGEIELVAAAAGKQSGMGPLVLDSTMGHSLHGLGLARRPGRASLTVPIVSVDELLAARPQLAGRRTILKIDVEGFEPEVLEGARGLLESGRVAAIVFEYGRAFHRGERRDRMLATVDDLEALGFRLFRFPHPRMGGPLIPFAPTFECFNVFALPQGFEPRAFYPKPNSRPEALPSPAKAPRDPALRRATTEILLARRASDGARWADFEGMREGALGRAAAAARFVASAARVLDLGSGTMALRDALGGGVDYTPADLLPWDPTTRVVDLNQGQFPDGDYDAAVLLEVIEFLHDPSCVLRRACQAAPALVLSYSASIGQQHARGGFNAYSQAELEGLLVATGWSVDERVTREERVFFSCSRA